MRDDLTRCGPMVEPIPDDLVVGTGTLRRGVTELGGTAYRLGQGLASTPGLTVPAPDWAAAGALDAVESAVHAWLGGLGGAVAETAGQVRVAADGYDSADDRAARRLDRLG